MSDLMLFAVLRMPSALWTDEPIDRNQRHARYIEAADRIERQNDEIERLRAALVAALPVVQNERVRLAYNCEHAGAPSVIEGYRFLIATLDAVIAQADAALGADR